MSDLVEILSSICNLIYWYLFFSLAVPILILGIVIVLFIVIYVIRGLKTGDWDID